MSDENGKMDILLHWGGNIIVSDNKVDYDREPQCIVRMKKDISFDNFVGMLSDKIGVDSHLHPMRIRSRYTYKNGRGIVIDKLLEVNESVFQALFNPINAESSVEIYLDFEIVGEGNNQGTMHIMNEWHHEIDESVDIVREQRDESNDINDPTCLNTLIDPPLENSEVSEDEEFNLEGMVEESVCYPEMAEPSTDVTGRRRVIPLSSGVPQYSPVEYFEQMPNDDTHDLSAILVSSGVPLGSIGNELRPGMSFADKRELQLHVQNCFVQTAREFRVTKSTTRVWYIKCNEDDCNWEARASFKASTTQWVLREVSTQHTCLPRSNCLYHRNIDMNMVAQMLTGLVRRDPTRKIGDVIQLVKEKYGFDITYAKAWHSLRRALEIVYGSWESSVTKLPRYMCAIQKYVPGTVVEWLHLEHEQRPPPRQYTLGYLFWAFKPCIDGYKHCRSVISVDGTHLYGRYRHVLLIAATLDADNHVLPLAFAIVDAETNASWTWFLQLVAK